MSDSGSNTGSVNRLPEDPVLLMSVLNTYLRDRYDSLDEMIDDMGIDKDVVLKKLSDAGFDYLPEINQFR